MKVMKMGGNFLIFHFRLAKSLQNIDIIHP